MTFEEFEKEFERNGFFVDDCRNNFDFLVTKALEGEEYKIHIMYGAKGVIIGRYDTLKEAYEALKAICKLNDVEM